MKRIVNYTMKETIAYYILALNEIEKLNNANVIDYINILSGKLKTIDKNELVDMINLNIDVNDFYFYYNFNTKEMLNYAVVVFYTLSKSNRDISKSNLLSELDTILRLYTTRTIQHRAKRIIKNYNKQICKFKKNLKLHICKK